MPAHSIDKTNDSRKKNFSSFLNFCLKGFPGVRGVGVKLREKMQREMTFVLYLFCSSCCKGVKLKLSCNKGKGPTLAGGEREVSR
jgi:hypothetical protein